MDNNIAHQIEPQLPVEDILNHPDVEDANASLISEKDHGDFYFEAEKSDSLERSENFIIVKEENLFQVSTPLTSQLITIHQIIGTITIDFIAFLVRAIICAGILLDIHEKNEVSIKPLIDFLFIFEVGSLFLKLIQYMNTGLLPLKLYHNYRLLQHLGNIFMYGALSLYLANEITWEGLKLGMIPYCILCLLSVICVKNDRQFFVNAGLVGDVFQTLQLFYIFSFWKEDSYYLKYLFFLAKGVLLKIICYGLIIIGSACLFFMLMTRNGPPIENRTKIAILSAIPVILFGAWFGNVYLDLINITSSMINWQKITPENKVHIVNSRFYEKIIEVLIFASINLILVIGCYIYTGYCFRELHRSFPLKGITLATFAKDLRLRVKKISQYFFKFTNKTSYNNIEKNRSNSFDREMCYICCVNKNDIIIKPCGHSGICKVCFLDYIKQTDKCPMCKLPMNFAYHSYYNKKEGAFYAKQLVKIK